MLSFFYILWHTHKKKEKPKQMSSYCVYILSISEWSLFVWFTSKLVCSEKKKKWWCLWKSDKRSNFIVCYCMEKDKHKGLFDGKKKNLLLMCSRLLSINVGVFWIEMKTFYWKISKKVFYPLQYKSLRSVNLRCCILLPLWHALK
jgi:hypothetical protein